MAKILTVSDAALALGISRQRVNVLCKTGRISAARIGAGKGVYVIDSHSLLQYQRHEGRKHAPVTPSPGRPKGSKNTKK